MRFPQGLSWLFSLKHVSNKLTLQPKKEENDDVIKPHDLDEPGY